MQGSKWCKMKTHHMLPAYLSLTSWGAAPPGCLLPSTAGMPSKRLTKDQSLTLGARALCSAHTAPLSHRGRQPTSCSPCTHGWDMPFRDPPLLDLSQPTASSLLSSTSRALNKPRVLWHWTGFLSINYSALHGSNLSFYLVFKLKK